jgi:gas vesicle protein
MSMNEFTYFGLGAAAGAAVGVLFASRPGSETREYLRSKAENGADYVTVRASDVRDAASQVIERGKKAVKHQTENLTAAVDASIQTYQEASPKVVWSDVGRRFQCFSIRTGSTSS